MFLLVSKLLVKLAFVILRQHSSYISLSTKQRNVYTTTERHLGLHHSNAHTQIFELTKIAQFDQGCNKYL